MKFKLLTIGFFLSTFSFAQSTHFQEDHENFFRFGGKIGVNANKIQGQSFNSGYNYNYLAGVFLQFNFSNRFGFQPEFNLTQTATEFSNDPSDVYYDIIIGGSQKNAKLDYLQVPMLLNINVGTSKRVKIQLGPSYGNLLKQTGDSLKANGNIFKKADWAAVGGIWIQIPFVNLGARYQAGLSNLNAIDNRQSWKNQSIQFFVGISF